MNLQIANEFAKKMVANEDAAVAELIRAQSRQLLEHGQCLEDYEMVRESKLGFPVSTVTYRLRKIGENI